MRKHGRLFVFALLLLLTPSLASAWTLYVKVQGNSSDGTVTIVDSAVPPVTTTLMGGQKYVQLTGAATATVVLSEGIAADVKLDYVDALPVDGPYALTSANSSLVVSMGQAASAQGDVSVVKSTGGNTLVTYLGKNTMTGYTNLKFGTTVGVKANPRSDYKVTNITITDVALGLGTPYAQTTGAGVAVTKALEIASTEYTVSAEYTLVANAKAVLSAPLKAEVGKAITVNAAGSTSNSTLTYVFSNNKDFAGTTTGSSYTFTPTTSGDVVVTLTLNGGLAEKTATINVLSAGEANNNTCVGCHAGSTPTIVADYTAGTLDGFACTTCHTTAPHNGDLSGSGFDHSGSSVGNPLNILTSAASLPLVISNVVFGEEAVTGFITATFTAKTGTTPVTGMTASVTSIALTGLLPGTAGASDEWKYWGATTDALVENSAGNYTLTTNKLVTAAPASTTTQRALIQFNNGVVYQRANAVYDFLTSDLTVQVASGKEVVNDASCKECHGFGVTIHSFGRNDTKACVVCHGPEYSTTMAPNEADMVTMVHQIHSKKATTLGNLHWGGHGDGWGIVGGIAGTKDNTGAVPVANMVYPDNMLNCDKCHNTVAQADNWKNKPTTVACGSCHTTVTFDGIASVGIKGAAITHTDMANCALCHNAAYVASKHVDANDAALRTIVATITGNPVVDANGGVTVTFSVTEGGVAKTNLTAASFTLAKLVPAANGQSSYWESYLMKMRTKTANHPVMQAQAESQGDGTFTNVGAGVYTYKFGFKNSDVLGDITKISKVGTRMAADYALNQAYNSANLPSMVYPVAYEPNLTHRLGISITNNAKEAFIDFVPAGNVAATRNIVQWETSCNKCHGEKRIHSGYSIERCVGCHTKNTFDPYSSTTAPVLTSSDTALAGPRTVELGTMVHKIHMGRFLPSVQAGGSYSVNGSGHDYSKAQYPGGMPALNPAGTEFVRTSSGNPSDCKVCHDESNAAMTEAANWKIAGPACGSCHDGANTVVHISANTAKCASCHTATSVEQSHYGK